MIIGECPYCEKQMMTPISNAPCFTKEECSHCKKQSWLKHSRFDPVRYTQEGFDEKFEFKGNRVVDKKEVQE
jgi:hypothetical protein